MTRSLPPRFLLFVSHTIKSEIGSDPHNNGGWNKNASDHGGATQWGIASNYNPKYATKIEKKQLTKDEALNIYYNKYYRPIYNIDQLPPSIAFMIFDARVHGSTHSTVKSIQTLTNFISDSNLKLDGRYGPNTYRAISRLTGSQVTTLLNVMKMTVPFRATSVAKATMITQKRKGIKVRDFSRGFSKRFSDRINQAIRYA